MKDINSSLGGSTYPAPDDDTPGIIKGITVRNLGLYGRRVGIYTNEPDLVVGSKLHAGDYRHASEVAETLDGYPTGKSVELSGARKYHAIFSFKASAPFHLHSDKLNVVNARMGSAIAKGLLTATEYNPATSLNDFPTGNLSLARDQIARNHVSFTLTIAGTNYNFALDVNKHPALLTADLNYQLANVNHNLRAYVAVAKDGTTPLEESAIWTIHLAVPTTASIKVPRTDYNVELHAGEGALSGTGLGKFQATHLNNALLNGLDVTRANLTEYDMTPIADSQFATAKTVAQLVDAMKSWTNVYPDTPEWNITHILLSTDFHVLKQDTRYKIALVEVSPQYIDGDFHQLKSANYVNLGVRTPADLLVVNRNATGGAYGTRLIDVEESITQNRLVGLGSERVSIGNDTLQYLPEKGSVNGGGETARLYGSRMAIAVIAPANEFNHFTPLYRSPTDSVSLELSFNRDSVDQSNFELNDNEYEWSKESDSRIAIALDLDAVAKGTVVKATAVHNTGTIEETYPTVTQVGDKWHLEFTDGFSQRDLTFNQSAGHIDFTLDILRKAPNDSADTNLRWTQRKDYSVLLPTVLGQVELQTVPKFVVDLENEDLVVFIGVINLPTDAPESSRNPFYYSRGALYEADVNGNKTAVASGTFTNPTNYGQDAPGLFEFSIEKSVLSEFGPGTHTLNISTELDLLWNSKATFTGTVQFQIIPLIEGIEDDVTFFTPEIFNANTANAVNSNLRIVDLDTGEVLAESTSLQDLITDAETRGLVEVAMIYGNLNFIEDDAINPVSIGIEGTWTMEVDGVVVGTGTMEELKPLALAEEIEITSP